MIFTPSSPTRLLSLRDSHGAPLADFDWHASHDLLEIQWHGHLTATSLVQAVQISLDLPAFANRALPQRVLSNHRQASGSWEEALPWLQYDWLPRAQARGLRFVAYVLSPDPASRLDKPDQQEFVHAIEQALRVQAFRTEHPAWHWLTRRRQAAAC